MNVVPQEMKHPHNGNMYTFTGEFEHWRQFHSAPPFHTDYWYPVYEYGGSTYVAREHKVDTAPARHVEGGQ